MDYPAANLTTAYGDLTVLAEGLDDTASWLPTGCRGWAVRDLLFHLLGDAQRALVALATPAEGPADRDSVSYWRDAPGRDDPDSRELRAVRTMAATFGLAPLVGRWAETAAAAVTVACRTDPAQIIRTQGLTLTVHDFLTTLVVEAAVHHLDLAADGSGPAPGPLRRARRTVDALWGTPTPAGWDDAGWVLTATGRRPPTVAESAVLGVEARRLPLLS